MKPPPPRFPALGKVTARAKWTAMAASTAFPPRRRTSAPASEAWGSGAATTPPARGGAAGEAHEETARRRKSRLTASPLWAAFMGKLPGPRTPIYYADREREGTHGRSPAHLRALRRPRSVARHRQRLQAGLRSRAQGRPADVRARGPGRRESLPAPGIRARG